MAGLWTGTTLNTNELAKVFNKLAERKSIPMVVKANSLFYSMAGKPDDNGRAAFNKTLGGWMKSSSITGKNIEFSLLGSLDTPGYISDGSDELTTASISYTSNQHGAVEFAISHLGYTKGVPASEYQRFKGSESKTPSWIDETYDVIMYSYEKILGDALHNSTTTNTPSRSKFASWESAVDDSNTYGLDRSDAGNADFRAIVNSSFGNTTLDKLQQYINQAKTNMGRPRVGVAGITLFTKIQQQIQAYTHTTYDRSNAEFGSDHAYFAGVDWLLDQRCPDGYIGIFDPAWWELVMDTTDFVNGGLIFNWTVKHGWILHTSLWAQNFCKKPNAQIKLSSAT